ncbi:hypothetical protein KAR91_77820 [Candidatus Pacearchaeota archaeon]|nr:hypothetical protein [Candidatus Pacearchaeota archaeon]
MLEARVQSVEILNKLPRVKIPSFSQAQEIRRPQISAMFDEGPNWVLYMATVNDLSSIFLNTAPFGFRINSSGVCAGVGVNSSDGKVTYSTVPVVGSNPAVVRPDIFKTEAGRKTTQGQITAPGRMNGPFGWSVDRNLIAGVLASFRFNFLIILIAYFERGSLPLTRPWSLPNMVLAPELREEGVLTPNQLHPAASFTFLQRPSIVRNTYTIDTSCETPATLGIEWWDPAKRDLARIDALQVPAGSSRNIVTLKGSPLAKRSGFFNINVIDAPKGITIDKISVTPPSF